MGEGISWQRSSLFFCVYILFIFAYIAYTLVSGWHAILTAPIGPHYKANNSIVVPLILLVAPPLFIWWTTRTPRWEGFVQLNGKLVQATVLDFKPSGLGTRTQRWWRAELRVHPTHDEPFEITIEKPLEKFGAIHEGGEIYVKYDLNNKKHVVVIPSDEPSYAKMQTANLTADQVIKLAELHDHGKLTDAEFEAAKKKLLS